MPRPFDPKENYNLNGNSIETLVNFLENNCDQSLKLVEGYTIANLVSDLDKISEGIWSDGIDAMGEDA